ncbi:MAG: sulfite exporter TauE/SafE family protein [Rhizobiaceae bacterium]
MDDSILSALLPAVDPTMVVFLIVIFLLAGIVKGFLGIGMPAAAMGLMTLILPPTEAIALLWLPILATNALQFAHATHKREIASIYWLFALALIVSIFLTSMFIGHYPTALLTVSIGIAMVVFSLNLLVGLTLPVGPGKGWQVGFGVLSGVLGGVSSIWSPTVAMYLVARNVDKERFIGATGFLFLVSSIPLGAGEIIAGLITVDVLLKSLIGLVAVLIGFRIGELLRGSVSQTQFRRVVLVAFLIMGVRLIAVGVY